MWNEEMRDERIKKNKYRPIRDNISYMYTGNM